MDTFADQIGAATREIEELLVAMQAGERIGRSDDLMHRCERYACEPVTDEESDKVEDWARNLACDLSKLTD